MTKAPTHLRLTALVVMVAAAMAACGGGGKVNTSSPTTSRATTTTTNPEDAQRAAVLDAYRHYVDVYIGAHATSNADDPGLPQVLTGAALLRQKQDLSGLRSANEVLKVTDIASRPVIVSLEPARAVLDDCLSGIPRYYDMQTGAVRGTVPAGPSGDAAEYVLVLDSGLWKVSEKTRKDAVCHG
jgi:hypothetical protein